MLRQGIVLVLLLAPLACAAPGAERGRLDLDSSQPIRMDGGVDLVAPGGILYLGERHGRLQAVLEGVRGDLHVYEWKRVRGPFVQRSIEEPTDSRTTLRNGTLVFDVQDEGFFLSVLAANGTAFHVRGDVASEGRPGWVAAPAGSMPILPEAPGPGAPSLDWRWERGWPAVGRVPPYIDAPALLPASPVVSVSGAIRLQAAGGNLSVYEDGAPLGRFRLSNSTETPVAATPVGDGPVVVTARRAILEATVEGARVPAGSTWGLASPAVSWGVDGRVEWRDATGSYEGPSGRATFERALVRGEGEIVLAATPGSPEPTVGPVHSTATGEWRALAIDGRTVASAPAPPSLAAAAGAVGAVALLVALAWIALYTRLAPGELARHPRRAALLDIVRAEPGIHLRELQRRLGVPWGVFEFHLGMLRQAGLVTVRKEGRYAVATLAGVHAGAFLHPVARAILDALPPDGALLPTGELAARAGVSRQLCNHHLKALAAQGLVQRERGGARRA